MTHGAPGLFRRRWREWNCTVLLGSASTFLILTETLPEGLATASVTNRILADKEKIANDCFEACIWQPVRDLGPTAEGLSAPLTSRKGAKALHRAVLDQPR